MKKGEEREEGMKEERERRKQGGERESAKEGGLYGRREMCGAA